MSEKVWQGVFWSGVLASGGVSCAAHRETSVCFGAVAGRHRVPADLLLKTELREPVWRDHPFSAKLLTCSLLAALLFAGFNAYSFRGNRDGDRDFSVSVGKMLHASDLLVALGSYPDVLPYYARHAVVSVNGLDELKKRIEKRAPDRSSTCLLNRMRLQR